jgi:hypothetical protein
MTAPITPQLEQAVDDGSESYCTASFVDQNGVAYVPSSLFYRIDDLTNVVNVVPFTSFPPATSVVITITSTQNTMNVASGPTERRQVLLKVGIPGGSLRYDDITYVLLRKTGTP